MLRLLRAISKTLSIVAVPGHVTAVDSEIGVDGPVLRRLFPELAIQLTVPSHPAAARDHASGEPASCSLPAPETP